MRRVGAAQHHCAMQRIPQPYPVQMRRRAAQCGAVRRRAVSHDAARLRKAAQRIRCERAPPCENVFTSTWGAGRDAWKKKYNVGVWKKKYFEEKRKTVPLEEASRRLKTQLDMGNRKIIGHLEKTYDGPQSSAPGQPSQQASSSRRHQSSNFF